MPYIKIWPGQFFHRKYNKRQHKETNPGHYNLYQVLGTYIL